MGKMNLQDAFFAMVFSCTTDTIETEKIMQQRFKTMLIPTPREISKSCGFAIRFFNTDAEELIDAVKDLKVPYALYLMSPKDQRGRRTADLMKEAGEL